MKDSVILAIGALIGGLIVNGVEPDEIRAGVEEAIAAGQLVKLGLANGHTRL